MPIYRILLIALAIIILILSFMRLQSRVQYDLASVHSVKDLVKLFPHSVDYLERAANAYLKDADALLAQIKAIPDQERTYENTIKAFDYLMALSDLALFQGVLAAITYLYPEQDIRDKATVLISRITAFFVDTVADKQVYHAIKVYADNQAKHENLNETQQYFIDRLIADFKRGGLELPDDKLMQVKALNKELVNIAIEFDKNIAEDKSTITVDRAGLEGVDPDFIATLKQDDQGRYILGVDYPTIAQVLDHAISSDTRKHLYVAFLNRAYPANIELLNQLIAKRHELAQLLGFASYAELDLNNQMAKTPENAQLFIDNLIERATIKDAQEFQEALANLPEGVQLSPDGKLYPWDVAYVQTFIKKKKYAIDERAVAEYFPVEHTLQGMLDIYATFFSLRFESQQINDLWVPDLTLLTVYKKDNPVALGYVILDLYPRANKYSHAACQGIIPATYEEDGTPTMAVVQVMANFPRAQGDQPALFKRSDVKTFFHEFGHALHNLLGRTEMASDAGTAVKHDFVEMPSQMLEEWIADGKTLQALSRHYKTGKQLPDDLIANIQATKHCTTGYFVIRQSLFSTAALTLFGQDQPIKDIGALWNGLSERINKNVVVTPETHFYASFGHLTGYGAKYYGYLWSKVFALDLFSEIKKHGLLNPEIGARYADTILAAGGSADPNDLLKKFLGRLPNDEAFFRDMGI